MYSILFHCCPRTGSGPFACQELECRKPTVFAGRCSRQRGARLSIFVCKPALFSISACYTWHRMDLRETFSNISRKHVTVVDRLREDFIVNWPLSWCMCPPPQCNFAALSYLYRNSNRFACFCSVLFRFPCICHWMGSKVFQYHSLHYVTNHFTPGRTQCSSSTRPGLIIRDHHRWRGAGKA